MIRRPPRSTRTDTLFPYTTLFRSSSRQTFLLLMVVRTVGLGVIGPWNDERRASGSERGAVHTPALSITESLRSAALPRRGNPESLGEKGATPRIAAQVGSVPCLR